jgi:hypothetical protein
LGASYSSRGNGSVKGRPTAKVNANSGRQKTWYTRDVGDAIEADVDADSGLVVQVGRIQRADKSMDLSFLCTWTFSNFQTVNGLVLPFLIEKSINGRLLETISVESAQLNVAFPPDLFARTGGRQ